MGKVKPTREITAGEVNCLEYLVVAYNTVLLMSSIFLISIAGTTQDLFSDFNRLLSPPVLLLIVGCFIVLIAGLGYVGIGKKSSTIMSLYTLLLMFIFIMEISAGLGILSFKREIRSVVTSRMRKSIKAYPHDPMTANVVDFFQLELRCCGINNFRDWKDIFDSEYSTKCKASNITLPPSCCRTFENSTAQLPNERGCLPAINFMLHRSSVLLCIGVICVCGFQALGAYFSYLLACTLRKFKNQNPKIDERPPPHYDVGIPMEYKEANKHY